MSDLLLGGFARPVARMNISRKVAKEDHAASNLALLDTDLARPSSFLLESQILRRRQLSRTSLFKQLF